NAGITQGWEDIAPSGADTRVYPLQLTHTTADAHAGTNTASCGLGVYRGDLMPELKGNIFVPDPTGQLVTRYIVEPNGASLKATRVGDHKEFFGSHDEWCRPVNITTGPDGALYVCDMYRRYIDHARFFPESFVKTHDIRQGENEGRIWRVVPKGKKARKIEAAPKKVEELVAWLGHENAWQRETAQRLLVEKTDLKMQMLVDAYKALPNEEPVAVGRYPKVLPALHIQAVMRAVAKRNGESVFDDKYHLANGHDEQGTQSEYASALYSLDWQERFFWAMNPKLGRENLFSALSMGRYAQDPEGSRTLETMVRQLVEIATGAPDDPWIQKAVLSSASKHAGEVLRQVIVSSPNPKAYVKLPRFQTAFSQAKSDFVRALASCSSADANAEDFAKALSALNEESGKLTWWKPALLQGLSEGLPKSGGKLGVKTLAQFTAAPPEPYKTAAAEITTLLGLVDTVMLDAKAPTEQRLACIPLLAQRPWDKAEPVMRTLLDDGQPLEISTAAFALLKKFGAEKTAPLLYELLPKLGPTQRLEAVKMLTGNGKTVKDFFERIDRGELPKAFVDAETRWRYLRPGNPMHDLALKIFGSPSGDRAAVITAYHDATKTKGDSAKGQQVFATICITCHKVKGLGMEVGPDITDVRIKEKEALLSDILDPNRMVEARWMAYQIDTKDGRMVAGLIAGETSTEVTVKMAAGITEVIPRSNIAKMKCLDASLMPVGLEGGITKEQMADLLAYLKGE
ncbi:MAG: PVC-type heme-binding CxxCH protein, partial [Roseimicrobium sp.]